MVNAFTSSRFPGISGERSWQSTSKLSYFEAKKVPKIHKFESRILIFSKKKKVLDNEVYEYAGTKNDINLKVYITKHHR